jgi:hypothetical protein
MSSQFDVITAVEKLNYRVTVGDVSAQSGLDLNLVQTELLSLASNTSGNLQVSETGEVVYVFSPEVRKILRDRNFKLQVQAWLAGLWKWVFFVIRISFGILLIVSIAIVVMAIIVAFIALQSRNSNDDNNSRSDNRSGGGGFGFIPNFFWFDFGNVFAPSYYDHPQPISAKSQESKMGFLESIFSFLFGDGNPNFNLEERRNRAIAETIRNHGGVVIAEQIAPYLDEVTETSAGYEDYMIPVLAKFNGLPQVTDIGTLAYTFPELQKVAEARSSKSKPKLDGYLEENLWQFSKAGAGKISLAIALGIFYLGASLVLGNLLIQLGSSLGGFLGLVAVAFPLLLGYAVLFLTIPTVRYFVLQFLNNKIKEKNLKRAARSQTLQALSADLKQKLKLARQFAIAQEVIGADNLAYTTETDLNDQEYAKMFKQTPD